MFNTNVFKSIKLAMSPEEIKKEEDKVLELSKFLKETAIPNLIQAFAKSENVPTDSMTLRSLFHSSGVNIRYLGYLAEQVKDKNMSHTRFMLEREVVARCVKHILNLYIRDFHSEEQLSALICHVFNCLFAPNELRERLDDGSIHYIPSSMQE